jgi:hypothetical protein
LLEYSSYINKKIEDRQQFQGSSKDHINAELILYYYNERHPGLNASYVTADRLISCFNDMAYTEDSHNRFIVNNNNTPHTFAANIYTDLQGRKSLFMIDSTAGYVATLASYYLRDLLKTSDRSRILTVYTRMQSSPHDCMFFCLMYLKQMMRHEHFLIDLHSRLFDETHPLHINKETQRLFVPESRFDLPAAFYKHTHSRQNLENFVQNTSGSYVAINKKGENLRSRHERCRGTFFLESPDENIQERRTVEYSNSIELKRKDIIDKLLAWEAQHPELFD